MHDRQRGAAAIRVLAGALAGAVVGAVQCTIVVAGMRRTARTAGLAGIGVAARWALVALLVTCVLLLVLSRLLQLRLWALSAVALVAIELAALLVTWPHARQVQLHGDMRAALFAAVMIVEMSGVAMWWPRRERRSYAQRD